MRRVTIPKPQTKSPGGTWGLVELLQEKALGLPDNFSSVESCNRVTVLSAKLLPLRGLDKECVLVLSDSEHEFLCHRLAAGLHVFARESGGAIPPNLLSDIALYARALHAAEVVSEPVESTAAK